MSSVAISNDGKFIVSAGEDRSIKIYEIEDRNENFIKDAHAGIKKFSIEGLKMIRTNSFCCNHTR